MTIETPFKQVADFDRFLRVVRRETTAGPVLIFAAMSDGSIIGGASGLDYPVDALTELNDLGNHWEDEEEASVKWNQFLELSIAFSQKTGYDSAYTVPYISIPSTGSQWSNQAAKRNPYVAE